MDMNFECTFKTTIVYTMEWCYIRHIDSYVLTQKFPVQTYSFTEFGRGIYNRNLLTGYLFSLSIEFLISMLLVCHLKLNHPMIISIKIISFQF